ncbi:hypothetical protein DCS_03199 [Drechmeria coniospora]|uniref:C2H2-type domain-containing protein n=1 Tax=Drechmeria coniospora TaxID=98403 RepID=A0A151GY80_DRECN|nr:hypothetical protein DCS_03199 [Drechmeria coniospora]KYK62054.1 hypothetical protein DCS_03199 [Drechmeria coniospora]ODA81291.1 hypothetical protein RJ55_04256 [Drechmeria coniospora]
MAAFQPVNPLSVNANPAAETMHKDSVTPSAPTEAVVTPPDDGATPTRATFAGAASGQKPLPTDAFPRGVRVPDSASVSPRREAPSTMVPGESMDVDMDESDAGEEHADDGSDDESVNADGSKSSKKKKSQRFYCTDYPPCNLSFTRSEHLARHIRKHTGERPFQCHCSRRFSRLDNLRQHAQTVHVNEDIPMDSLAATGSRFQRHIRAERVRQAGNRARASTGGSAGGPVRGHSKSLSTSSIASISSMGSSYAGPPDLRRRPSPLVVGSDPRSRHSLESYHALDGPYSYRPPSPSDFGTPTSATFSTTQSSPRWGSGMVSPISSHSRSQSVYVPGKSPPGRRLSIPSAYHAAHAHQPNPPPQSAYGPALVNGGHAPTYHSPTGSTAPSSSAWGRRDSAAAAAAAAAADDAWRRRTWHPDSRGYHGANANPPPSQLSAVGSQSVRPNPPPPMATPSSTQTSFRLPGIESFDPLPPRNPSPMSVDGEPVRRHSMFPPSHAPSDLPHPDERRNLNRYDASLQRGLTRLDIGRKSPPRRDAAGAWASDANRAVQAQAEHARQNPTTVRFEHQVPPSRQGHAPPRAGHSLHQQTMSAPSISQAEGKRHAWYHGPAVHANGTLPAAQDPRGAHADRIVHPNLNGAFGFPARERSSKQQDMKDDAALDRLEALVAVATSEGTAAAAY